MRLISLFLALLLYCGTGYGQEKMLYQGYPVINAKSDYTDYRVGGDWYRGYWSIAPEVAHDTLFITCYEPSERFMFKTDMDSIQFDLSAGTVENFYIKMDEGSYAHTIVIGSSFKPNHIRYDEMGTSDYEIKYQVENNDYLEELLSTYPLDFIRDDMSDTDIVLAVLNWTHNRWDHNGNNAPSKNDAITILNEASEGQQFPCFAYAIVLRDQLTALGYNARTVYLKTEDAAHRYGSPGHVATEVFLDDLQQWVFVDGQFNVLPMLHGHPLNAVQFQHAISNNYDEFELASLSDDITSKKNYVSFVYDYLFYLDTTLDNRYEPQERFTIENKRSMMLVPVGADELTHIDFWDMDVDYCVYTHSLRDFYAKPE